MQQHKVSAIVFDVGRVLIDFSYDDLFDWLEIQGAKLNGVNDFIDKTDLLAYEHGHVTNEYFLGKLNSLLPKPIDDAILINKWLDLFEPIDNMLQLAQQLKTHHRVYLLSNTSALHWQHIVPRFRLDTVSHGQLASFEIGAMKPDPAIFCAAEQQFELNTQSTVFIDDIVDNTEGAIRCGWQGIHHKNSLDTRQQLQQLGVILE